MIVVTDPNRPKPIGKKVKRRPPAPFPAVIALRRLEHDLSIRQVAAALGVSPSTVWRWETGERKPSGELLLRLLTLLDISLSEVLI